MRGSAALRIFAQFGAVEYRCRPATQGVAKFRNRSYEEVRLSYTQNSVSPIDATVVSLDHPVHAPAVRSGPGRGQCDTQCNHAGCALCNQANLYVDLHSAVHPGGEMRGPLKP